MRFHSEAADVLGRSGVGGGILGDEGPGTGEFSDALFGTGFREGEVILGGDIGDEAAEAERSELLTSLPFPEDVTDATDDCFLFFLMRSPGVVAIGETSEGSDVDASGGREGLLVDTAVGGGVTVGGGGVCELADEFPPPQSLRTPFICDAIGR